MYQDNIVLCACSKYEEKYYFNEDFSNLPQNVQDEIHAMSVLYTEDIGGVFIMEFDEDGNLNLISQAAESDLLYDEIGSVLKIKQLRREKKDLFEALETYFKVFFLEELE